MLNAHQLGNPISGAGYDNRAHAFGDRLQTSITTAEKLDDMCFKHIIKWADPCPHMGEEYSIPCREVTRAKDKAQCERVVTYTSTSHAVCGRCGEGDKGVFGKDGHKGVTKDDWHSKKGEDKVRSWGYTTVYTWKDEP